MIHQIPKDLAEAMRMQNERAYEIASILVEQYRQSELAKMMEQNRGTCDGGIQG